MRDFPTQVGPVGEPVSDSASLTSSNANDIIKEIQGSISSSGQTLIPVIDPADDTQLSEAIARYGAGGASYGVDSGAADAYVITLTGTFQPPTAYFDGMVIAFRAANASTGASTINAFGLGVIDLKTEAGGAISTAFIDTDEDTICRYDSASGDALVFKASGVGALSGGLVSVQILFASGTWNKPAGISSTLIRLVGAGGGGSGAAASNRGSGGGGGGYSEDLIDVTGTSSETVTIGAGGAGGAAGANAGSAGGTTSFGAFVSATGGGGGSPGSQQSGGAGGAGASGGGLNATGNPGHMSLTGETMGQNGGGSLLGGGGQGRDAQVGLTGGAHGGGGASGSGTSIARAGGAGADGIIIVEEYS